MKKYVQDIITKSELCKNTHKYFIALVYKLHMLRHYDYSSQAILI
jgi:hypothetical protein